MNQIFCQTSNEDAKKLNDSIIEVQICDRLYKESVKRIDISPLALKIILDYYLQSLKLHKQLWKELLIKYIGEDDTATFYNILRFDTVKNLIFKMDTEGCSLCSNK